MSQAQISISQETPWSTTLYTVTNPMHDQVKAPILGFIRDYMAQREMGVESGVAPEIKSGLFESAFDFFNHEQEEIQSLKQFCAFAVMEIVKHVNEKSWETDDNFSLEFRESWFHVTRKGGYHDFHNHSNCSWCGIYYLDIGDSVLRDGSNSFFHPRPAAHNYMDYGTAYLMSMARFDMPPQEGKLIVFPSYVYHSAILYTGNQDRVVVSFNAGIVLDP